jgi:alpha-glucosidase
MTKYLISFIIFLSFLSTVELNGQKYSLISPDRKINISVDVTREAINWSAKVGDETLFNNNKIGLTIDGKKTEESLRVIKTTKKSVSEIVETIVAVKSKSIKDEYNQLNLLFKNDLSVTFRVFNNGIAYRFETFKKKEIIINDELMELNFEEDNYVLFPEETTMVSHFERLYLDKKMSSFEAGRFASLPTLIKAGSNIKIGITESDLFDYPCLFLEATGKPQLKRKFPKAILEFEHKEPYGMKKIKEADYIAKTAGTRTFPWRVFMISKEDKELVENQMVYLLSRPCKLDDTSWIKTGLSAWEWWHDHNLYGVDFKTGINNATYKYYIDFASKYKFPYLTIDAGWSKTTSNLLESRSSVNIPELVAYGKERNVDLILWAYWNPLDKDMDKIFAKWEEWGVKGLKVDFLMYSNQYMVNFYERVAKSCAQHHLVVDFHGAFKPTGLGRTYPNVLSYEGVKGLENCKWDSIITPEHNVTLPFTRMLAGPMDYTPGSMRNANRSDFHISNSNPMSLGTRCHQVAMYVVYDAPLQMLSESPSNYNKEVETIQFLSKMKTVWDQTKVLDAKVGDYIVTARKSGNDWYIGAMTDDTARTLELDLSFLDSGEYAMEIMQDGINVDKNAIDYKYSTQQVNLSSKVVIKMASGGGWASICKKL